MKVYLLLVQLFVDQYYLRFCTSMHRPPSLKPLILFSQKLPFNFLFQK